MTQLSAKARKRKSRVQSNFPAVVQELGVPSGDGWWWGSLIVLLAAALLRLIFLTQKPLHHDEGVNGMFLVNLFRTGYYHYDPSNYHGPSLYYLAVIPTAINNVFHWGHGLSTFAIRFVTASFGVGVVWLMLCLRRYLGSAASLAAAAFATVSPGFVFFSRYFIHEILFVFFSLGVIVAWLWYRDTGKPRYLMLSSASAAMLFATKETWIITAAVWLIAIPCTTIFLRLRNRADEIPPWLPEPDPGQDAGSRRKLYLQAAALFAAIAILLYSSFFTHPRGILDSVLTFTYWTKTGRTGIYNREWSTYFSWLWQEEAPILVLGLMGTRSGSHPRAQLSHGFLRFLVDRDFHGVLSCAVQNTVAGAEHYSAACDYGRRLGRTNLSTRHSRIYGDYCRSGDWLFSLPGNRHQFCEL